MDFLKDIIFEDPDKIGGSIKATIQKTGKIGFSSGAEEFMGLKDTPYFKIGFNSENAGEIIYMVSSTTEEGAFKVSKAGSYYYINLKNVFDRKGIDYKNKSYIYDIRKENSERAEFFILTKRKK
ncbi:hypothetical protein SD427_16920 [Chryseobacterium sp. JJR-5R]|uniref:hypothetical protein n=1 Tax=Chryseobacterium sp. JJR-5R TaxID=3093923 RepID=UPI002A76523E|nr:hypothetical protein [Chryseobacterium sp. JJR-5R]WPO82425.1 hypothetical protein SD427_16920 [Chryseobacterium sp. JJR-5R]